MVARRPRFPATVTFVVEALSEMADNVPVVAEVEVPAPVVVPVLLAVVVAVLVEVTVAVTWVV